MTPKQVQITHGHHAGQIGVWLHDFRGVPMIRLSDTVGIPVHQAHFDVIGEAVFAPITKSFNQRADHRAAQRELEHAQAA